MRMQSIRRRGRSPPRCLLPCSGPAPPCRAGRPASVFLTLGLALAFLLALEVLPLAAAACSDALMVLLDRRGDQGGVVVPGLHQRRDEVDATDLVLSRSSWPGRRTGRAPTAAGRSGSARSWRRRSSGTGPARSAGRAGRPSRSSHSAAAPSARSWWSPGGTGRTRARGSRRGAGCPGSIQPTIGEVPPPIGVRYLTLMSSPPTASTIFLKPLQVDHHVVLDVEAAERLDRLAGGEHARVWRCRAGTSRRCPRPRCRGR